MSILGSAMPWMLLVPLLTAVLVGLSGRAPNLRDGIGIAGGIVLAMIVYSALPAVMQGARPELVLWTVLPGLELAFKLEPLGLLFACVASALWPLTTSYGVGYMRGHHETNQTRFFVCFAIAIFAAVGIALSANLLTLFIFYEALTLSTVPLVTHAGNAKARRGGRIYLGILLTTSIGLLLPAIIWTYALTGTTDFTSGGILTGQASPAVLGVLYALFVLGIGKAATMPFHLWLPSAMVAPTPVSALLHAVAVVKAGVFCVVKVTLMIFGLDLLTSTDASEVMMWASAFTLITASLIALSKDNLKARLAYSTVSQLAYIVLGATLATSTAIVGAGAHIVMHALGKITLFFVAGTLIVFAHKTKVSELDGLGRKMPITFAAFLMGSLMIIGLPPFGGAWSKLLLLQGSMQADQAWLLALFAASSLLSISYLLPVVVRGFFRPLPADSHHTPVPATVLIPVSVTALLCVVAFFAINPIAALIGAAL